MNRAFITVAGNSVPLVHIDPVETKEQLEALRQKLKSAGVKILFANTGLVSKIEPSQIVEIQIFRMAMG